MILSVHCWAAEKNNDERLPQTVEQDEATQQETEESETKIWRLLEMTEREKMLSGELYDPTDKELEQLRLNARKLSSQRALQTGQRIYFGPCSSIFVGEKIQRCLLRG